MVSVQKHQEIYQEAVELKRIFSISLFAFLLFGLSVVLDGPVTMLAWILTAAGFLCVLYIVVASYHILNQRRSNSRKAESQ